MYNNKGKVVEKYEPYFDTGFFYKPAAANGEKVTMYYDPRGQVVRTVNPDGTEQRVLFGIPAEVTIPDTFAPSPWEQYTYDAADLGIGGTPNPDHQFTPKSAVLDALGRTVKTVDRLVADKDDAGNVVMRYEYDIRGNRTKVTDALDRVVFKHVYDLKPKAGEEDPGANVLYTWHIDGFHTEGNNADIPGSVKTSVFSAAGTVLENRDSKGALVLHAYDQANRPVGMWACDKPGEDTTLRQRLEYGDSAGLTDPSAKNLNGQLYRHFDEAGMLLLEEYDFKGNLLKKNRKVLKDTLLTAEMIGTGGWNLQTYKADWEENDLALRMAKLALDDYTIQSTYDGLNRPVTINCPNGMDGEDQLVELHYNRAGALAEVKLDTVPYVRQIAYNAKGQRLLIAYGNNQMTRYAYEDKTFRLARLRTERYTFPLPVAHKYEPVSGTAKQDLAYAYDLASNITGITDRTTGSGIANTLDGTDKLIRNFKYDALYRLERATGRETGQTGTLAAIWDDSVHPADSTLAQAYAQEYTYDPLGNIVRLAHTAANSSNSFTRVFSYQAGQNLLDKVTVGSNDHSYEYDANGNQVLEADNRKFAWDYADRLRGYYNQTGTNEPTVAAHYLYDAGGQRLKKITRKPGSVTGIYEVTVYIDGLFEHRYKFDDNGTSEEQTLLHIMDDQKRIASKRSGDDFGDTKPPIQYFLDDHLGSSSVVLSETGTELSREEYYPFGETSFGSFAKKRYRFCGKERDEENGLYYYVARYYAPWICRFVSVDALAHETPFISSFAYADDNPVMNNDPTGNQTEKSGGDSGGNKGGTKPVATVGSVTKAALNGVGDSFVDTFKTGAQIIQHPIDTAIGVTNLMVDVATTPPAELGLKITTAGVQAVDKFVKADANEKARMVGYGLGEAFQTAIGGEFVKSASYVAKAGTAVKVAEATTVVAKTENGAKLSSNAAKLNKHLTQLEKYGKAGTKELQNGKIRYYGEITPASKPGEMVGRRVVREWDPSKSTTRTWMETLDGSGKTRIVRPETGGPKVHYQFNQSGKYTKKW